jgi:hypothetical protein
LPPARSRADFEQQRVGSNGLVDNEHNAALRRATASGIDRAADQDDHRQQWMQPLIVAKRPSRPSRPSSGR